METDRVLPRQNYLGFANRSVIRLIPPQPSVRTGAAHGELPEGQEKPPWGAPVGGALDAAACGRDWSCSTGKIMKPVEKMGGKNLLILKWLLTFDKKSDILNPESFYLFLFPNILYRIQEFLFGGQLALANLYKFQRSVP